MNCAGDVCNAFDCRGAAFDEDETGNKKGDDWDKHALCLVPAFKSNRARKYVRSYKD